LENRDKDKAPVVRCYRSKFDAGDTTTIGSDPPDAIERVQKVYNHRAADLRESCRSLGGGVER